MRPRAHQTGYCYVGGIRRFRRLPQIFSCYVPLLRICPTRRRDDVKPLNRAHHAKWSHAKLAKNAKPLLRGTFVVCPSGHTAPLPVPNGATTNNACAAMITSKSKSKSMT